MGGKGRAEGAPGVEWKCGVEVWSGEMLYCILSGK